jgi:glycosyltransferase involved in cell wall biosynthesis
VLPGPGIYDEAGNVKAFLRIDACARMKEKKLYMESQPASLSIVIPCYNEKATIRSVVEAVLSSDSCGLCKEIVIVDDYSKDGTRDLLAQMEQEYAADPRGKLMVFYQPVNQGKGAAVRAGFQHATGDIALVQDADLEYDPVDFPHLLRPILDGHADAVFGNRFHGGVHRVLYFWHYQANRMLTLVCSPLCSHSLIFSPMNLKPVNTSKILAL